MTHLATGFIMIWIVGILFLTGRALNFTRLIYNNLAPGKNPWTFADYFSVDISSFRGRIERIFLACVLAGFALFVCYFSYISHHDANLRKPQLVASDFSGTSPASCTVCATIFIAPPDSITACASSAN
jgi:hypothetical protein